MSFDDELAEGEPQPRAARTGSAWHFHLAEFAENHLMVLWRNSGAVIADGEKDAVSSPARIQLEMHWMRGVRHRVLNQIGKNPLDEILVASKDRRIVSHRNRSRGALLLKTVGPLVNQLGEESPRCHRRQTERDVRLLDSGDFENVVDKRQQILRLRFNVPDCRLLLNRDAAEVPIGKHFERRQDRGQRRLEIVHDHLHQVVAHFLQLPQLAKAVLQRIGGCLELQQAAHARAEHESIVRLGKKIVATGLDPADPVAGVVQRRDENHRYARSSGIALYAAANLEAGGPIIHPEISCGHGDVEYAEIGVPLERGGYCRRAVSGGGGRIAQAVQLVEQELDVGGDVVRYEYELGLRLA